LFCYIYIIVLKIFTIKASGVKRYTSWNSFSGVGEAWMLESKRHNTSSERVDKDLVTNRCSLYRNRELVYWLRAVPRPVVSSGIMSEALSLIIGSILGSIARY
jgi:hypothetical protein